MATVTRSTVWSDGNTLTAAALNGEFNNLLNALALVNADISGSAAITESKLLFSATGHGHTGGTDGKLISKGYGLFSSGIQTVTNDVSWNPTVPAAQTATRLSAYARTAPTGAGLTVRVYNVTQANVVASVTIAAGANTAQTTTMTNASLAQNDILRMDITAIGSTVAGSDVSVILT